MKKILVFTAILAVFTVAPIDTEAAPQCDNNRAPNLKVEDPACYTTTRSSRTKSYTYTDYVTKTTKVYCRWTCTRPLYICVNSRTGAQYFATSTRGRYGCGLYSKICSNNCGGSACLNNPPRDYWSTKKVQVPVTRTGYRTVTSTSNTCYYTTVNTWSECDTGTGVQSATSVTQHSTSGTNCQNRNEATIKICGICDPATDGQGSGDTPTGSLCKFGTAKPVPPTLNTGTNMWEWSCLGEDATRHTDDDICSAPRNEDGECSTTAGGEYIWSETSFRGELCSGGTLMEPNLIFPEYGERVTWGCQQIGDSTTTSTATDACSAQRSGPQPGRCSIPNHNSQLLTKPTSQLCCNPDIINSCTVDDTYATTVIYDPNTGKWTWSCNGSGDGTDRSVSCEATCKPQVSIDISPNPYPLPQTGTDVQLEVTMHITGVCNTGYTCTVNGGSDMCNGGTQIVTIQAGDTGLTVDCQDANNDSIESISGYCTQRECNEQGTCQATPKSAVSVGECSSTCNSNADCSRGRMIETRP